MISYHVTRANPRLAGLLKSIHLPPKADNIHMEGGAHHSTQSAKLSAIRSVFFLVSHETTHDVNICEG